ncbi:MAG: hypothetical protein HQ521_09195, partial [Bacteroidetes bacterium]|nr:hypothetical protein [Bacteroidota bacterium]
MKKVLLLSLLITVLITVSFAQVAINTTGANPSASAILDLSSDSKGLLIPRMATNQRLMNTSPVVGLLVFDTDYNSFFYYTNQWVQLTASELMGIDGLSDAKTDAASLFMGNGSGTNDGGTSSITAVGINSLYFNTWGTKNTAIGTSAMLDNTTGYHGTGVGYEALGNNTTGIYNSAFGSGALRDNTTGENNVGVGLLAGGYNKTGSNNTSIGAYSGTGSLGVSVSGCVYIGKGAGSYNNQDNKLFITNTSGGTPLIGGDFSTDQVDINGTIKITGGTPGSGKVLTSDADGLSSWETPAAYASSIDDLSDAKTDASSVFLGSGSGIVDDGTNNANTALGTESLNANTTGATNTAIGRSSLTSNISGNGNTSLGSYAMYNNTVGASNIALGSSSLYSLQSSGWNVSIGNSAMYYCKTGENNVAIGTLSDYYNQTGSQNTIIGCQAGHGVLSYNKSGSVMIGYQAGYNETGSNKLYIENSNSITPLIGGDFSTNQVDINGTIKITGGSPGGGKVLTSDADGDATWETPAVYASQLNDLSDAIWDGASIFIGDQVGTTDDGNNYNTALGDEAFKANTSGQRNTAVGYKSLIASNGGSNSAIGFYALGANTSGDYNTAVGSNTIYSNTTGNYNTALGYNAFYSGTYSNSTAIGYNASISGNNQIHLGNTSITEIKGQVSFTTYSDGRIKENVKE